MNYSKWFSEIACGSPTIPTNGNVRENGSLVGTVVEFTCNDGYLLIGTSSIFCQQDGNWSSQSPLCQGEILSSNNIVTLGCFQVYLNHTSIFVNNVNSHV